MPHHQNTTSRSPAPPLHPSTSSSRLDHNHSRRHRTDRDHDRDRGRGRSASPDRDRDDRRHRPRRSRSRSRSYSPPRKRAKSRSRSRSRDRKERRRRARSSSDEDSDDSHARRKKDKRREKEKRRSGSKERRKKEKRDKKKRSTGASSHWGKYGIISDIDIFSKQAEFHTWLVEERKMNPETISKDQQKKEFARFVEDFNTATLPHEKYYNIDAYDKRMNALRQGEYIPPADMYDFEADMKAVKGAHKKKAVETESYLSREEIMELRRVQQERTELSKMKLLGMDIKSTFGVRMDRSVMDD